MKVYFIDSEGSKSNSAEYDAYHTLGRAYQGVMFNVAIKNGDPSKVSVTPPAGYSISAAKLKQVTQDVLRWDQFSAVDKETDSWLAFDGAASDYAYTFNELVSMALTNTPEPSPVEKAAPVKASARRAR